VLPRVLARIVSVGHRPNTFNTEITEKQRTSRTERNRVRLEIDNFDDAGVCDYTAALDAESRPKVLRKLNRPAEMNCGLVALGTLSPPVTGARVAWRRDSGEAVFTGYLTEASREYLGWNETGPVYRYRLRATGDEYVLDAAVITARPAMVQKSAGEILREITPGNVDVTGVDDCGVISQVSPGLMKWSDCAALVAKQARAAYLLNDGKLTLKPIGERAFRIREVDPGFSPERLRLQSPDRTINDITVLGKSEADAYVKDYFLGDGYALHYDLSQTPFGQTSSTLLTQEYDGPLDPAWWSVTDPNAAVSVSNGKLWVLGVGAKVSFAEQVELKGALLFQHGDVTFTAASDGVIGGLYNDAGACTCGFKVSKVGSQSSIAAMVNGSVLGGAITTQANHRYLLSTRVYANETVRCRERYRSSAEELGGALRPSDARVVFEVHDVDLNNQASLVDPATVLYDGVVTGIPSFCEYRLAYATDLHCGIAYTRMVRLANVLVRSALPGQAYRTRLAGALMDGAECNVYMSSLQFYSANVPAPNEKIVAEYRGYRKSVGRATTPLNPTEGLNGAPRSAVVEMVLPTAKTSDDCGNAAQAILDDAAQQAWSGEYTTWSDFLGAADVWPGDAVQVEVPSRECSTQMIVRQVEIEAVDPANERSWYAVKFANEACEPIAIETGSVAPAQVLSATQLDPAVFALASLPQAQVTDITSTSVTIETGCNPITGGGFEIRRSDSGWDPQVDRNLVGRFNTRVITVTRLSRVMSYWVRQYDAANRYSRSATLLHVDYPL
jgi:hypothetical protein